MLEEDKHQSRGFSITWQPQDILIEGKWLIFKALDLSKLKMFNVWSLIQNSQKVRYFLAASSSFRSLAKQEHWIDWCALSWWRCTQLILILVQRKALLHVLTTESTSVSVSAPQLYDGEDQSSGSSGKSLKKELLALVRWWNQIYKTSISHPADVILPEIIFTNQTGPSSPDTLGLCCLSSWLSKTSHVMRWGCDVYGLKLEQIFAHLMWSWHFFSSFAHCSNYWGSVVVKKHAVLSLP